MTIQCLGWPRGASTSGTPVATLRSLAWRPAHPKPFPPQNTPLQSYRHARPIASHAAAVAAAAATNEAVILRVATGVPLVDIFQTMSLSHAFVETLALIGIIAAVVFFGNEIIVAFGNYLNRLLGGSLSSSTDGDGSSSEVPASQRRHRPLARLLSTVILAAERPASVLLPWFGIAYSSTVVAAFAEIAVCRLTTRTGGVIKLAGMCGNRVVDFLKDTAQLMQDTSEVVVIVFG